MANQYILLNTVKNMHIPTLMVRRICLYKLSQSSCHYRNSYLNAPLQIKHAVAFHINHVDENPLRVMQVEN